MPKRKEDDSKQVSIKVGDISDFGGTVNIAGGNISTQITTGLNAAEITKLFKLLYSTIEARPSTSTADKADLKAEVQEIQEAVKKAEEKQKPLDKSFLARRFRNIARMAPDILDVVVAALPKPLTALGVVIKKIVEKAKAETL